MTIDERMAEMRAEGKSLSTSKSYAKLYNAKQKSGGSTTVYGKSGLSSISNAEKYGTSGSSSSITGSNTIDSIQKMYQKAAQPAVNSYAAGIPETQAMYGQQRSQLQAEQTPLASRYDNLINQIKGNQTTAENRQSVTTSNELGRRGILGDTGLGQQEMTNALNPITSEYTGMIQDTGYAKETALRDLANQISNTYTNETAATRAIRNALIVPIMMPERG